MLRLYRRIRNYTASAQELAGISDPAGVRLLTDQLDAKILALQVAVLVTGLVVVGALAVFIGANSDQMGVMLALSFLGSFWLSKLARAFVIHHVFNTQWNDRSFNMPEARVLF